jgi:O-succinylbenzoic acid--CoA ligase
MGNATWSRGEVAAGAGVDAAVLKRHGVGAGTVCATLLRPGPEGVLGLSAAWASEGVVAPLSPDLTPAELGEALCFLRPIVLLVEPATEAAARAAVGEFPPRLRPTILGAVDAPPAPGVEATLHPLVVGEAVPERDLPRGAKLVIWTSGTTGAPRAILHRGAGVVAVARSQLRHMGIEAGDALPLTLPLSTVGGHMILLRSALAGGVVVPMARFDADETVRLVRAGNARHLSLVPVMLQGVLESLDRAGSPGVRPLLRRVLVGGAPCPVSLVERAVAAGLPVALTWGMTESCAQAATATPAETREDPTSVGRPLEHVEVRVQEAGRLALRIRGLDPVELMRERTGELRLRAVTDRDGWIGTGDLGELTADGRVRITGRIAHRIISGGVNVDPVEVERHLEGHPEVAEAAVVGLPDARWGERVAAAVVPRAGAGESAPAPLPLGLREALEAHSRRALAPAKRPRVWVQVVALPRSHAGKLDRDEVRHIVEAAGELT